MDNYIISNDYSKVMYFTHGSLYNFYLSFKDWFSDIANIKKDKIYLSNYSKAAERIRNIKEDNKLKTEDYDKILTIDPTGEINMEETQGRELWRYSNIMKNIGKIKSLGQRFYKDDNIEMSLIYNRISGTIECRFYLSSLSNYLDYRMYFLQLFRGGQDRVFKPYTYINKLIFSDNFIEATYYNEVTKQQQTLNWDDTPLYRTLVKQLGKPKYVYPIIIHPTISLSSMGDSSNNKNVGQDLDYYILNLSINFEFSLPAYMFVDTNYMIEEIHQTIINTNYAYVNEITPDNYIIDFPDIINLDTGEYYLSWNGEYEIENHNETWLEHNIIFELPQLEQLYNDGFTEVGKDFILTFHNNVFYYPSECYTIKNKTTVILDKKYLDKNLASINIGIYTNRK